MDDPEVPLRIGVLGPLLVVRGDVAMSISRGTPSLLLSALTARNGAVSTPELLEVIGQVRGRAVTVATIHTAIWRLRARLGDDVIVATDDGYVLDRRSCVVDAEQFGDLVEQARELLDVGQPTDAADTFEEALALWRGGPFPELQDARYGLIAQRRLIELRAVAVEELAVALRAGGRPRDAVPLLEALVVDHALREHAWALLVGAHLDSGRVDEARAAFDRARLVLAEFGVTPGRELEAAIRPADASLPPVPSAPMSPLPALVNLARRSPLVGRTGELAALDELLTPALAGRGAAFIVLSGPAGVGKTRLAAEAAATAHERGATAWFEIGEPSAVSPLTPLGYWARQVVAGLPDTRAAALRDGALAPLLEHDVATDRSDLERERTAQFEAVADLFASVGGPSMLILDDAHNVPPDTLACLSHLLRTRPNLPLAIIATVRPAAVPEHAAAAWTALRRLPSVHDDIPITELEPHDAALLFSTVVTGKGDRLADSQRLVDATGGNPALIMAVAALPDGLTGWPEGTGSETNALLAAAVRTMTEQLDPAAHSVLELLAVIASVRPFMTSPTITSAWTRLDEPSVDLASAIEMASSIGLLSTDRTSGALLFRHEMLRDVVYAGVDTARRRQLHLAVARSAAEGITGDAVDVDAVAEHYERAWPQCGADEVAAHALRAATHALSLLDVDRAISLARRSLTQLASERSDPASRSHGELLVLLAGALAETGDVNAASEAYRQAADLAQAAGWIDLEAIARTHCLQMRSSRPAPDDPDITGLRRVILAAPALDRTLVAEGLVYLLAVDPAGSTAPVDALLTAAEAEGDHRLQLKILQELTWSTPLDERARYQAAYAEIASRLGEPGPLARVGLHAWMADIEHGRSRFDLPWEPIGALVREAREPLLTYDWRLWRATVTTNQGRWDEASRLIEAARTTRFAQTLRGPWLQERPAYISAVHAFQLGSILYERGEMELLHAVGSQFPIEFIVRCSVDSKAIRARVSAEVGDPLAMALCDEVLEEPSIDGPETADWLASMTYLASACGVCGHRRGAELCLERLAPYLDRHILVSWTQYIGAVRHNMSFAYALLGDLDAADDALATSVAQYDAMGAKPFATLGRHHHAQLLEQRGRPADRREAALLNERVLADATELQMTGLLRSLTGP